MAKPDITQLRRSLTTFMQNELYPLEAERDAFTHEHPWKIFPPTEALKEKARAAGLWNLFLPEDYGAFSPGLTNLEYAPLAELMGRIPWASEIFNCNAPDTGNMEVLARYGTPTQQARWLTPLMAGTIRSAFLMTEPQVASSDATNVETRIVRDGDDYLINGRKWWSTGAMHPNLDFFIVMGKTDPTAERHVQQSMIIVPAATPGVRIVRPLRVFGMLESPEGHAEIELSDVRVPAANLLVGEGQGFAIAQGRLGPGRIHHCMRLIGAAQRSLELMCKRVNTRSTFGKTLSKYSSIRQDVARSRCAIAQARLLTLEAARRIDTEGIKGAKDLIAMIKLVVPTMAQEVIDRAIQAHGGLGVCQDTPLPTFWVYARALRLADGPDEVHAYQLGRNTIRRYADL